MEKVPEIEICMLNSEDVTSVEGEAVSTRCRKAGLGPKIEIPVRIGNVNAVALLDCGADLSAINADLLKNLKKGMHRLRNVPVRRIRTALGCVYVNNQAELAFEINGKKMLRRFHVVPDLKRSLILGTDWMSAEKLIMMQIIIEKFKVSRETLTELGKEPSLKDMLSSIKPDKGSVPCDLNVGS